MRHSSRGLLSLACILLAAPLALVSCGLDEPTGPYEDVPIILSNHTGAATCIKVDRVDAPIGACGLAPNGGYQTVHMSLRHGDTVQWGAFLADGFPPSTRVTCKWRGETAVVVDYQVLEGDQTASLICVVWSEP